MQKKKILDRLLVVKKPKPIREGPVGAGDSLTLRPRLFLQDPTPYIRQLDWRSWASSDTWWSGHLSTGLPSYLSYVDLTYFPRVSYSFVVGSHLFSQYMLASKYIILFNSHSKSIR